MGIEVAFFILIRRLIRLKDSGFMSMQHTIATKIVLSGRGLHSGRLVRMEILPAAANTGIVFQRTDIPNSLAIEAQPYNITSTDLSTTVGAGANAVSTIEHLMAAFAGLEIDNALVKVNAPEIPIMDGSSTAFVQAMLQAGFKRLNYPRRQLVVRRAFEVRQGDRFIRIEPARRTKFKCSIEFKHKVIGRQSIEMTMGREEFIELSNARTFCHINDVNAMRQIGLAQGGSLENAIVVTDDGVMNPEGLRGADEFVRHKLLDCIGDLAILGAPLVGLITVNKPGHALQAQFMVELLKQKSQVLSILDGVPIADKEEAIGLTEAAIYG